jgi:hypothetical protein
VYELEGIATIGGLDIAEVLTESVGYRTMSLFDTRPRRCPATRSAHRRFTGDEKLMIGEHAWLRY